MELPTLESQRLLLRKASSADIDDLYSLYSKPEVVRFTGDLVWTDTQQAVEFLEEADNEFKEQRLFGWCVALKQTDKVIGTCALFDCELAMRFAEIAYAIDPNYWRKGLTRELVPLLIEFGFNILKLNRIDAVVAPENSASVKLLEGNHFQHEGFKCESWIDPNGNPVDEYIMGLLHRDWMAKH